MHTAAYAVLGAKFAYQALDVQVPQLAPLVARVRQEGTWYGFSVTMPLKNAAVDLVDQLTPVAAALGAVNTIVCTTDEAGVAHLVGENTDVAGIVNSLRHAGVGERPRAAILGGGGTAVSAIAALHALDAACIDIFVRNIPKSAGALDVAGKLGAVVELKDYAGAAQALAGYDVVISTLPPHGADGLAQEFLTGAPSVEGALLLDVAYDPWPSALGLAWERAGGSVVAGIEMLLYQGVEQVRLFAAAGGYGELDTEQLGNVINVMCDAIGVPRRNPYEQNMAG